MDLKSNFFGLMLIISALTLLGLSGCSLPDKNEEKSVLIKDSTISPSIISREHHEFIDPQDRLFVTYWETGYDKGTVTMDLSQGGYDCNINYVGISEATDVLCGKGIKPCLGETISWTTNLNNGADFFGVYGWLRDPLVEYYIGKKGVNGVGEYNTDQGHYTLYVDPQEGSNILNPTGNPNLPKKFLQFNCDGPKGSPINMAQHYAAWERLMANQSLPSGWTWHHITVTDYCVVATEEGFLQPKSPAETIVSNIQCTFNNINVRLENFWQPGLFINVEDRINNTVECGRIDQGWLSAKWQMIKNAEGYYLFKCAWTGNSPNPDGYDYYLHLEDNVTYNYSDIVQWGKSQNGRIPNPGWWSAQWSLEITDNNCFRIRNRWKSEAIWIEHLYPFYNTKSAGAVRLEAHSIYMMPLSAMWYIEPVLY